MTAALLLGLAGCGDGADLVTAMVPAAPGTGGSGGFTATLPAHCAGAAVPPATLECTGLYADLASKTLAPGVREYAPAYPLWSDGADKRRWIGLPAGSVIDASDPNEWVFPVGTRLWKEFSLQGTAGRDPPVAEGQLANFWVNAVYVWNAGAVGGPALRRAATSPSAAAPTTCPRRTSARSATAAAPSTSSGFSAVDLGLPGATGVTLEALAGEGRLSAAAGRTQPEHRRRRHRRGGAGAGLAARQLRQHLPQRELAGDGVTPPACACASTRASSTGAPRPRLGGADHARSAWR